MDLSDANQRFLLRDFNDKTRLPFKDNLFERNDDDLIQAVENVILSCQRQRYFTIKVTNFTVYKRRRDVDRIMREYEQKKIDKLKDKNAKAGDNPYDFIDINKSDLMALIVDYYISVNDGLENPYDTLQVIILLPKIVNKYYYRINGKELYNELQIVDGSTYNNTNSRSKSQNIVYKTLFMPTRLYRNFVETIDDNGRSVKCIKYLSLLFSKKLPIMEYLFARFGLRGAISFLGLDHMIFIDCNRADLPFETYDFYVKGIWIQVPMPILEEDPVTQSLVMTIYGRIGTPINEDKQKYMVQKRNPLTEEQIGVELLRDIQSNWYWLESLAVRYGSMPTVEKGLSVLDSLESIYDIDSHDTLRLPEEKKSDIYWVLKWLIREFPKLRMKGNTDMSTKKVRREEHLSAHYATKMSRGIYLASDSKKRITVKDIKRYINIDPRYLIGRILKDKLKSYVDDTNDNDAFIPLKWSFKGISGLGERKNSAVPNQYKYVHPSQLGRVDVDTSSAGDPGMTGILCPMARVENRSFADDGWQEPDEWEKEFEELKQNYLSALRKKNQVIELARFANALDIPNDANAQLDLLEASLETGKVAMEQMAKADATSELYPTDEFVLEDGTNLLVIYRE